MTGAKLGGVHQGPHPRPGMDDPMSLPLYVVDAFTSQPFAGNPAAVCLLDRPREDTGRPSGASVGCPPALTEAPVEPSQAARCMPHSDTSTRRPAERTPRVGAEGMTCANCGRELPRTGIVVDATPPLTEVVDTILRLSRAITPR